MLMASSVDLLALYANWSGLTVGGRLALICLRTMTGVSVMGL